MKSTFRQSVLAGIMGMAIVAVASCGKWAREGGEAVEAGELRVLSGYLPGEIDPYKDSRFISRILAVNVYDPLVRAGETGEPVPALAAYWSNPAPDAWRFQLRAGARFSDGTPVRASDVVRSFERARAEGSAVAGNLAAVRDVRADADDVVTITASEGASILLPSLTSVLVAREVPAAAEGRQNLGSGPYEVAAFFPGSRVELRASSQRPENPPRYKRVIWDCYGTGVETIEKLKAHPGTLVIDPPEEAVNWARQDPRFAVSGEFSGALQYLAFGFTRGRDGSPPPFTDRRTREAVRLALDIPALIAAMGPAGGYPATQVIPSGVFGFDPGIPPRKRDLVAARSLLTQTGAAGRRVVLDTTEPNARVARVIADQLTEAGLLIDLRVLRSTEFRQVIEGQSDLFVFSWVVGPDAGEPLRNFFHTRDAKRSIGLKNRTGFSNQEFDTAIQGALAVAEPAVRLPLLQRAIRVLDREIPWVPLFTIRSVRLHPAAMKVKFRSDGMLLLTELEDADPRGR